MFCGEKRTAAAFIIRGPDDQGPPAETIEIGRVASGYESARERDEDEREGEGEKRRGRREEEEEEGKKRKPGWREMTSSGQAARRMQRKKDEDSI